MIPFKDDNPTRNFPFVTIALIVINISVYILQITYPASPGRIAYAFGAIPHFLMTFQTVQPIHPVTTIFSSMFMHGSILHLGTNMLYLWIFGNNIGWVFMYIYDMNTSCRDNLEGIQQYVVTAIAILIMSGILGFILILTFLYLIK